MTLFSRPTHLLLQLLVGLSFFQVSAEVPKEEAITIFKRVQATLQKELAGSYIPTEIEFTEKQVPTIFAQWARELELGRISISQSFLSIKELSHDSLALILCHEMGHFHGGQPFVRLKQSNTIFKPRNRFKNMSAEGAADYFATKFCLPHYLSNLKFSHHRKSSTPPSTILDCQKGSQEQLCLRVRQSIFEVTRIYQDLNQFYLKFEDFDPSIIAPPLKGETKSLNLIGEYPSLQCRLDTMLFGAQGFLNKSIPSQANHCWKQPITFNKKNWIGSHIHDATLENHDNFQNLKIISDLTFIISEKSELSPKRFNKAAKEIKEVFSACKLGFGSINAIKLKNSSTWLNKYSDQYIGSLEEFREQIPLSQDNLLLLFIEGINERPTNSGFSFTDWSHTDDQKPKLFNTAWFTNYIFSDAYQKQNQGRYSLYAHELTHIFSKIGYHVDPKLGEILSTHRGRTNKIPPELCQIIKDNL